jgi:hypothetical protein
MRDPRTLGPYQPQRLPSILDVLEGPATTAPAAMAAAAEPAPSVASRIAGLAGGVGSFITAPFRAIREDFELGAEAARLRNDTARANLEQMALERQAAERRGQLEQAQLPAQQALAAAQARQLGELDTQIGSEQDPRRRQALIRGAATGTFRPFELEPGPAELAAYQSVLGMQEEEARQRLIASREREQSRLDAQLSQQTTAQRLAGELDLERGKRALGPEAPKISDIGTTQGRYLSQSQQFVVRRDSFENIQFAAQDDTGASDLTLLYNFIKLQDPNAVREGEIALSQQTSSIPDQWITQFNRVKEGDILSSTTRKNLIDQAKGIFKNSLRGQLDLERGFNEYATRNGLRPEDVTLGGRLVSPSLRQLAEEQEAPKPERRTINGAQYEKVQGGWKLVK